jgi:hypothetical protein
MKNALSTTRDHERSAEKFSVFDNLSDLSDGGGFTFVDVLV